MRFDDLKAYVDALSESEREILSDEGLILSRNPSDSGYKATPPGYVAFAWTGGNGVHFSFPEASSVEGPVVMTVPMAFDRPNIVVGESLIHFLSLGCRFGYFCLEQLAYDSEGTAEAISRAPAQSPTLKRFALRFGLRPWVNVVDELRSLQHHLTMH